MKLDQLDKMLDELADKYPALEDQAMELKTAIADLDDKESEQDEEEPLDMMDDEEASDDDMFAELPEDESDEEDMMA